MPLEGNAMYEAVLLGNTEIFLHINYIMSILNTIFPLFFNFSHLLSITRDLEYPGSSRGRNAVTRGEVALSSASRDNSTYKLQYILFLKLGSHYYRKHPVPAGEGSTYQSYNRLYHFALAAISTKVNMSILTGQ